MAEADGPVGEMEIDDDFVLYHREVPDAWLLSDVAIDPEDQQ